MRDSECGNLTLSPTDYFARQCAISSDPEDVLAPITIGAVGADHVMWASDFPQPDAEYPGAVDEFLEQIPDVDADARHAVLWDTPLRFYDLADRFLVPGT